MPKARFKPTEEQAEVIAHRGGHLQVTATMAQVRRKPSLDGSLR